MKKYSRAAKILKAVNLNEQACHDNEKDPFEDYDDSEADPTYFPKENCPPASHTITRESSGSQQTCEYLSCTSDIFSACAPCNSFLCWDHFDDYNSFNNCQYHNEIRAPLDNTLTGLNDEPTNTTLTDHHNDLDIALPDTNQHCEFQECFEQVFSTCIQCQGFLCYSHFNLFSGDKDCLMHKPFSTEVSNLLDIKVNTNIISAKKTKDSQKKIAKRNRNLGLEYINSKKKLVAARSIKPPCNDKTCRLKCTEKISAELRQIYFDNYWCLGDINRQRDFIRNHTKEIKPKYRYACENCHESKNMRALNFSFYFEIEKNKIRVCKQFFKSTLDINDRVINTVREKTRTDGFIAGDMRGRHSNRFKLVDEAENVRAFINTIPRVESHYLRAQSTREYIEGGRTLSQLYEDYKKSCIEVSKKFVSKTTFTNIFHNDFNISFFTPKKDRCEFCVSYENSNKEEKEEMKEIFDNHQKEKEMSRAEKKRDKEKVNPLYVVSCYDLQAVLTTPRGDNSCFYYISKLATYNLTIYELVTTLTTCFVWHEGQGHRGVTEIGSCIFNFLEKKSQFVNSDDLEIVFYSDNCCGQQKKKIMISMYLYAVNKLKIKSITHKFLIKGHTQNEGDSVHSTIEKEIKRSLKCGPIYSPREYVSLIKTAKRNPPYYTVQELLFDDFYDLKALHEQMGNNFSKTTENESIKVTNIKILQVRKDDPFAFYVKTSYSDEYFKRIEIRKHNTRNTFKFILPEILDKAYSDKLRVNEKKKQELLKLIEKNHIPKIHFDFYNAL